MIQLIVSILLFLVIFFGLAFILNMLLRRTCLMTLIYPIIVLMIVDNISTIKYFKNPEASLSTAFSNLMNVTMIDIIIMITGFVGTIISDIVIKILRKSGYQMF